MSEADKHDLSQSLSNDDLVERAIGGDQEAFGLLLQRYRPLLQILARRHLDREVNARVDASDIVQETCFEAYRDLPAFRGVTLPEMVAWLKRILAHNVSESIQTHVVAQKRAVSREHRAANSSVMRHLLNSANENEKSPRSRVMQGELAVRLAFEIEGLPDDQREAVRLRHLEGWTLEELVNHFGRSQSAVAGLLKRGLRSLRERMSDLQKP